MSAKELKASLNRPSGKNPESEEIWSGQEKGRYARSYDLLSDALMSIFEKIYLPLSVMDLNPDTGAPHYTAAGLARFEQLKDRYTLILRNNHNDTPGLLEIEISPSTSYKGILNNAIAENYLDGPEEIRNTITCFFSDLNEIVAGLPGINVNTSAHIINVNGPQAFHDMITALCEDKGIVTSEQDRMIYALNARTKNKMSTLVGRFIQQNIGSTDKERASSATIPEAVINAMGMQPYSWQEIGHLVHRFNDQAVVPILSLKTLQAAVDQDLITERNAKAQRPITYYLH